MTGYFGPDPQDATDDFADEFVALRDAIFDVLNRHLPRACANRLADEYAAEITERLEREVVENYNDMMAG